MFGCFPSFVQKPPVGGRARPEGARWSAEVARAIAAAAQALCAQRRSGAAGAAVFFRRPAATA
eukprot:4300377-Pyramimonas_sp.AAC.1